MAKIVAVGLAGIGIAEIAFRGTDAGFYVWYLLFTLWIVALFIRFILAAVDACKAAFAKGPGGKITSPEYEQMMASFTRSRNEEGNGPSNRATFNKGSRCRNNDFPDDDRINQIFREDDPFGEFFDF